MSETDTFGAGRQPPEEGTATTCSGVRAPPDGAIEITSGAHRIYVECPHIKGGACGPCVAAGVMPYLAARHTLDILLPKLAELADALEDIAHATRKLKTWTVQRTKDRWAVADDPAAGPKGTGP